MKKTPLFLTLTTLYIFTCSSNCHKSNSPTNELPPETHAGLNTMGCTVDGQLFIPQTHGTNPGQFSTAGHNLFPGQGIFFNWTDYSDCSIAFLSIYLDSIQLQAGATITLGSPPDSTDLFNTNSAVKAQWAVYMGSLCHAARPYGTYSTNTQLNGQIIIDYYDPTVSATTGIMAGRFSFDAVDNTGDTVHIRDGRFDMAIQQ